MLQTFFTLAKPAAYRMHGKGGTQACLKCH